MKQLAFCNRLKKLAGHIAGRFIAEREPIKPITFSERLKRVSIRGRVAFGITCLETYFKHLNLQEDSLVRELLEKLWEYVSSNSLDKWEEEIKEYLPYIILDTHSDNKFENYKFLTKSQFIAYQLLYHSLPKTAVSMIDMVAEIAFGNLYGGVVSYSEGTFDDTMVVIDLMNREQMALPDLSLFERSAFSEFHGWGNAVNKAFFAA